MDRSGQSLDAIQKLVTMYQGLARRRRMTADVLGEFYTRTQDRAYLSVAGLGAYGLLRNERGLHQVERRYKERIPRSGRERMREDRELLRVETMAAPAEVSRRFQQQLKIKVTVLKPARERLVRAELLVTSFDEPSLRSVEFWTFGPKADALARGSLVHKALLDGGQVSPEDPQIIRQYDLGLNPRVKDMRTSRTTSRVSQVLKGDVETLMMV
jgi:protein subunit release factor B